jgi:hypothetical protein
MRRTKFKVKHPARAHLHPSDKLRPEHHRGGAHKEAGIRQPKTFMKRQSKARFKKEGEKH